MTREEQRAKLSNHKKILIFFVQMLIKKLKYLSIDVHNNLNLMKNINLEDM